MHRNVAVETRACVVLDRDCGNLDGVTATGELLGEVPDMTLLASRDRRVELAEHEYPHGEETLPAPACPIGEPQGALASTLAGQWQRTSEAECLR